MQVSSEQLAAWLDGHAEPDVAAAIEQRLPDDADLKARVEALRVADRTLTAWADPEASPDAIERIVVRALADARDLLDSQPSSPSAPATSARGRSWGWLGRLAAAGAAVVVVVVGASMLWSGADDAGPGVLSGADTAGGGEPAASLGAPTAGDGAHTAAEPESADEPESGDDAVADDEGAVMESQERAMADERVLAWLARVAPAGASADGAVVATREAPPAGLVPGTELALPDRGTATLSRPSPGPRPQGMPPVDGPVPEGGAEPGAAAMDLVHACLAKHGATVPDVGRVILAPHPAPDRDEEVVVVVDDDRVRVLDTTSCGDSGS